MFSYVCFDNNARAQFRARELKSIKINADGEYVRLVIRNCHRNRLNTYNQVRLLRSLVPRAQINAYSNVGWHSRFKHIRTAITFNR